ncbi:hypothetical protein AALP_AA3G251700 [Arabis alpina]|uniref:Glycosyltransferase n=1 Tax=Arabis alpina TaxID=50452 RepID=A0A087HBJ7_ARAAL|nr:hypothetical protein AALP_AA3G251700 [Arabis alpina]
MKFELIFVPAPGISHLRSSVEMAKLLVDREPRLSVTVIILPLTFRGQMGVDDSAYVSALSAASNDSLRYVLVEENQQPTAWPKNQNHIEDQKLNVRLVVAKLMDDYSKVPDSPRIAGFVMDMFCVSMVDVANEFNVPSYLFYTSNAGNLALKFHVQTLYDDVDVDKYGLTETEFEDSEAELIVPSMTRPYPVKCLPYFFASKQLLPIIERFREVKGIMVNTVYELEPYALKFFSSGDSDTPPVYPVGPMLHLKNQVDQKPSEILDWLDEQPAKSVVFLCFGSMGGFSEEQAREIAIALDRSGLRFLWSLRRASLDTKFPGEFTNLEEILPEGFFDRTKERGKVVGWAPQVAVLGKPAIGGFVTHCGWNSMLESLWFGVPTAAWPLYAEQKFNAFEMVEELGLAVEIKKHWRGDLLSGVASDTVTADDIEKGVKCLMEQDSDVRKRVKEMSEKCHLALMDGGSSRIGLQKFIEDVMKNINSIDRGSGATKI